MSQREYINSLKMVGYLSLLRNGETREDIKVEDDLFKQIEEALAEGKELIANTIAAMGEEKVLSIKEIK